MVFRFRKYVCETSQKEKRIILSGTEGIYSINIIPLSPKNGVMVLGRCDYDEVDKNMKHREYIIKDFVLPLSTVRSPGSVTMKYEW